MKTKREREEACYICGHYHDVRPGSTAPHTSVLEFMSDSAASMNRRCGGTQSMNADLRIALSQYEGGVPCSVCGHRLQNTTEKGQQPSAYPSEILPGFLYLGNYDNASRCELLKAMDITHILNVSDACRNSSTACRLLCRDVMRDCQMRDCMFSNINLCASADGAVEPKPVQELLHVRDGGGPAAGLCRMQQVYRCSFAWCMVVMRLQCSHYHIVL